MHNVVDDAALQAEMQAQASPKAGAGVDVVAEDVSKVKVYDMSSGRVIECVAWLACVPLVPPRSPSLPFGTCVWFRVKVSSDANALAVKVEACKAAGR